MRRIRKLTIETERTFIFRNREREMSYCVECSAEAEMASVVEAAARAADVSEMNVYHLVESRAVHFAEDADGRVLICLDSLLKLINRKGLED